MADTAYVPHKHHLDRRAAKLAAEPGNDDDFLRPSEVANWFGVSPQWLELGRHLGYGPPFEKVGQLVCYQRGRARRWLRNRVKQAQPAG